MHVRMHALQLPGDKGLGAHLGAQGVGQLLHDLLLVKVLLRAPARLVRVPYALPQALRRAQTAGRRQWKSRPANFRYLWQCRVSLGSHLSVHTACGHRTLPVMVRIVWR